MSSSLKSTLSNLRDKLSLIEEQVNSVPNVSLPQPLDLSIYERNLSNKLKIVEDSQGNILNLDIRGDETFISKITIKNCSLDNVLKDEINSEKTVFLDFDPLNFEMIKGIMNYYTNSSIEGKAPYKIKVRSEQAIQLKKLELISFFKGSSIVDKIEFEKY